jgi:hypothetical protein
VTAHLQSQYTQITVYTNVNKTSIAINKNMNRNKNTTFTGRKSGVWDGQNTGITSSAKLVTSNNKQ